jgi:glutamine amidotransferase
VIGIIDYGMGNLRSVQKAFEYIGEKAIISSETKVLNDCDKLILPGVGSFGKGIAELKKRELFDYVLIRKDNQTKILGICLGMQFLLSKSYEDGENDGLDIVKGNVVKFIKGKIPQIGWNEAYNLKTPLFDGIKEGSKFYFVHSYYADTTKEFTMATCEYNIEYAAAIYNKNVYGVQFHPEKSGSTGLKLLKNFAKL